MTITKGSVVLFDYTLTDDDKEIIDSSKDGGPLAYLHGEGQIVKGLEKAMEGRGAGGGDCWHQIFERSIREGIIGHHDHSLKALLR